MKQTNFDSLYNINENIKAKEVRLIDQDSKMIGVVKTSDALKQALEFNLDLVEVSPDSDPPVCKITDFGKMRYEAQKKAAESRKKQKIVNIKEIKMSFNIGKSDYEIKINQAKKFIEKGNKVKLCIRMKGREITHLEIVKNMMEDILSKTEEFSKPESPPKLESMQMVVILIKK